MAYRLVFKEAKQVGCEEFTPAEVGEAAVRVSTLFTLMSTGTEMIVFNRDFEPETHWDRWVKYPFYPGYAAVGKVAEVGPKAGLRVGQVVVLRGSHVSEHVVPAVKCYPVPDGLEPRQATWFALAKIAAMGARAADLSLGDNVLVIGAGPVGQMILRWVRAAGAQPLVVVDSVARRLELARDGGATHVIARPAAEAADEIIAAGGGRLPRVVIDTTGAAEVFSAALAVCRERGRVVLLGDTGRPSRQHLTSDALIKGLNIVAAHDSHEDAGWNSDLIVPLFFSLVLSGRFRLDGLNTHSFAPEECAAAYRLAATRRGETMGILFDWNRNK